MAMNHFRWEKKLINAVEIHTIFLIAYRNYNEQKIGEWQEFQ